jgi:hypothetical protein
LLYNLNIMVLYAYMCGCAFSLRQESTVMILGDKPLLFQEGSITHGALNRLYELVS